MGLGGHSVSCAQHQNQDLVVSLAAWAQADYGWPACTGTKTAGR